MSSKSNTSKPFITERELAHELNNMLGTMRSSLFLLRERLLHLTASQDPSVERHLRRIEQQICIGDELVAWVLSTGNETQSDFDDEVETLVDCSWFTQFDNAHGSEKRGVFRVECRSSFTILHGNLLRQVLGNVIKNAFEASFAKHDQPSQALVHVTVLVEGDVCRIEVRDNGWGFGDPQDDTPLSQRKPKGLEIGLKLCKRFCDAAGASLHILTQHGSGGCVRIEWPLAHSHSRRAASTIATTS